MVQLEVRRRAPDRRRQPGRRGPLHLDAEAAAVELHIEVVGPLLCPPEVQRGRLDHRGDLLDDESLQAGADLRVGFEHLFVVDAQQPVRMPLSRRYTFGDFTWRLAMFTYHGWS